MLANRYQHHYYHHHHRHHLHYKHDHINHYDLNHYYRSSHRHYHNHHHRLVLTSVNSISSIPSPVYQCINALRLNMAENCSPTREKISCIAVLLPMKVAAIFSPAGGTSHTVVLTLFGIHSTKYALFLFRTWYIWSSTWEQIHIRFHYYNYACSPFAILASLLSHSSVCYWLISMAKHPHLKVLDLKPFNGTGKQIQIDKHICICWCYRYVSSITIDATSCSEANTHTWDTIYFNSIPHSNVHLLLKCRCHILLAPQL